MERVFKFRTTNNYENEIKAASASLSKDVVLLSDDNGNTVAILPVAQLVCIFDKAAEED